MSDELKSCPFCGSKAVIDQYSNTIGQKQIDSHVVECNCEYGCGARTGIFFKEKDAIEAWNKRIPEKYTIKQAKIDANRDKIAGEYYKDENL